MMRTEKKIVYYNLTFQKKKEKYYSSKKFYRINYFLTLSNERNDFF